MSLNAAAIRIMVASGMSAEEVLAVAEALEAEGARAPSKAAERTRRWRERKAEAETVTGDVTGDVTVTHHGDDDTLSLPPSPQTPQPPTHTHECITTHTRDGGSEGQFAAKPEPPKPKRSRGTRLPEDWRPDDRDLTVAREEGLTPEEIHRAATEFRNYWCSRSRDAAKLDWHRTWHNRVIEIGDRKRRYGARLATAPAKPGGGGRGPSSFADIFVQRHGVGAD